MILELKPIAPEHLSAVLELDRLCFGGLWTLEGYQRELDSPNSDLLGLFFSLESGVWSPESGVRSPESGVIPPSVQADREHSSNLSLTPKFGVQTLDCFHLIAMGCLWAILEEAHITILAVHPRYQRQGLGQALLYGLLKAAVGRGLERATLEVRASNEAALSLYHKFGFKTAGRRRHYYKDTGEDALILWRGSLNHPEFTQTLTDWEQQIRHRLTLAGWGDGVMG